MGANLKLITMTRVRAQSDVASRCRPSARGRANRRSPQYALTPLHRLARSFNLTPRWLQLVLTADEQLAVDDALVARGIDLGEAIRWEGRIEGLFDLSLGAGVLEEIARVTLGRSAARIIDVEGLVPFDWRSFDGRAALERVMPTLPGVVTGPGMFRYFGTDESRPPYLWASHEAVGLHVCGLLDERDWHAWLDAFDRATLDWPLRDLRYS